MCGYTADKTRQRRWPTRTGGTGDAKEKGKNGAPGRRTRKVPAAASVVKTRSASGRRRDKPAAMYGMRNKITDSRNNNNPELPPGTGASKRQYRIPQPRGSGLNRRTPRPFWRANPRCARPGAQNHCPRAPRIVRPVGPWPWPRSNQRPSSRPSDGACAPNPR